MSATGWLIGTVLGVAGRGGNRLRLRKPGQKQGS